MKEICVNCEKPYPVFIGRGLLSEAGERIKPLLRADRLLVVTDENVRKLHLLPLLASLERAFGESNVFCFTLPAGESAKTAENYLKIVEKMASVGLKRTDAALALGGGVVGDMTGFASATYMRGIDLVQIPTTLLAMIDSSVGGKTGVNLARGKNMLGAFYSPKAVVIDPDALATLDENEYLNGLGEGVKYAVIDPSLKPYFMRVRDDVESFIQRCVRLKASVVEADEREGGLRRILNLGHTVGHAIEKASDFEISHGIAVAEGISVMTCAALKAGEISNERAESIFEMLREVGIGKIFVNAYALKQYIAADKKADMEGLNAVFISEDGCIQRNMPLNKFLHYISKTDVKIKKSTICGSVTPPASKSEAHRLLIAAYLAGEEINVDLGADIEATKRCIRALVHAEKFANFSPVLNVGESGSTLRFLLPVACALGLKAKFVGEGRLKDRPIDGLLRALKEHGCAFEKPQDSGVPLKIVGGRLESGYFEVDGSVSSQYVTGLLFALPLLDGDSVLAVTGKAASASYVSLTLDMLARFGIKVDRGANGIYRVRGGQKYALPPDLNVEKDWSAAAALLVAGTLAGETRVEGLSQNSAQGDKIVVQLLRRAGADIAFENGAYVSKKSKLRGISFDAADCPDIVPVMATALSFADGESRISSVERLRGKESDRLAAVMALLASFGVRAECADDVLTIFGKSQHIAGEYPAFKDHRIAMSAAVAALATDGECVVRGMECVEKSYPQFLTALKALGADIEEV